MLWTPNPKTIEPVHLCPECGGIDRRRHPAATRDMRRYFSFHRVCCCSEDLGGTPTTSCTDYCLRVIVSTSNYCCFFSGPNYTKVLSVADGTYEVTPNIAGPNWTAPNLWLQFNGISLRQYSDSSCTTPSSSPFNYTLAINAGGTCISGVFTITSVTIQARTGSPPPGAFAAIVIRNTATNNEGDYISSDQSCGYNTGSGIYIAEGTVRIDRIVCGSL